MFIFVLLCCWNVLEVGTVQKIYDKMYTSIMAIWWYGEGMMEEEVIGKDKEIIFFYRKKLADFICNSL